MPARGAVKVAVAGMKSLSAIGGVRENCERSYTQPLQSPDQIILQVHLRELKVVRPPLSTLCE